MEYICSYCKKQIDFGNVNHYRSLKGQDHVICENCIELPDTELDTFFGYNVVDKTTFNQHTEVTNTKIKSVSGKYKCVPAPITIIINQKQDYESATNYFEEIINRETIAGWRFVGMEQVSTYQPAGCLSTIFGQKGVESKFNMLIFERK